MKIYLRGDCRLANKVRSFEGIRVVSSYDNKSELHDKFELSKNNCLKNSFDKTSKNEFKALGIRLFETLGILWFASMTGLTDGSIKTDRFKLQNQKQVNEIVVFDVKEELVKNDIKSIKIANVQNDLIPEFMLEKLNGEKVIYNYLAEKTIEKQDGTIVVIDLIESDFSKIKLHVN